MISFTYHFKPDEQPEFRWHLMADKRPTNEDARYLLMGNGGGMYVGTIGTLMCADGSMTFNIPNHRGGHMNSRSIKAWAEIPPLEVRP